MVTVFSYFFSNEIYSFYTKMYYTYIEKSDYENMIEKEFSKSQVCLDFIDL